ncbi:MAG: hypothetical protein ACE15D_04450 [Candidatus Eisenbacteria bacterium]|nr:hypothetical protein [Candidatus Eisenbacteria bacterium]
MAHRRTGRPSAFLLSPASCSGKRAEILVREQAAFDLARRLGAGGVPLGEAFNFLSGLYFRGKLGYARAFAGEGGIVRVITTSRGLERPETIVRREDLLEFASVPIDPADPRYRLPLDETLRALEKQVGPEGRVVLLGSIATGKYVDLLIARFGERLLFPSAFVGRGDMSRGGLMLRAVLEGEELGYAPVLGATRHGPRPPKLVPIRWKQQPQRSAG